MTSPSDVTVRNKRRKAASAPALELRDIVKSFGGAKALKGVSLRIAAGEVHGVLGENGSGKSTLIKVLAGFHAPDSGSLLVDGRQIDLPMRIGGAHALGIEFVHQDLGLVPSLSVTENLRLSDLASEMSRWHVSWRNERRRAIKLFADYGLTLDPSAKVADIDHVERALLAIVRAVDALNRSLQRSGTGHRGLLVLDEPTVFLPREGVEKVFRLVREIVARGASVLFVSHDLDEVREVTDRVTVLRDGANVGTVVTADTSPREVVDLILGRELKVGGPKTGRGCGGPVKLRLRDVSGSRVRGFDLQVGAGETVGITGLVGSGFEELPYLLFGSRPDARGTMTIDGARHDLARITPRGAISAGLALVPADRLGDASVPNLPISDNVTLQLLDRFRRGGVLRRRRMLGQAQTFMHDFDVRPRDARQELWTLSGGNQQKVVLAKWLAASPKVLLLHEPTQGVDIGSREQIFEFVREATDNGMSVICASSDYDQLAAICDRVLVLRNGAIVAELQGPVQKQDIVHECFKSAT
ncbi:sugar ABC transporter ATP-binding protein [Rhodococcus sp. NPDC059968]|uniref:sugar ABC transporter ATP-binding protein n=1 Tax=Rhodococcus sp. NPDC059968 TaxID=3347017 RepID=UPI0036729FF5